MLIPSLRIAVMPVLSVLSAAILFSTPARCAAPLQYTTTWIGNTFGSDWAGGYGTPIKHVQQRIEGAFVTPDGTVLANSGWDEGGIDCGLYKDDDLIGRLEFGAGGWGRDGGDAVTANGQYIYAAMVQRHSGNTGNPNKLPSDPPDKSTWYCVYRFLRGDGHSPIRYAPWPTGYGWDGAMLVINTNLGMVRGLAVDKAGRLYVSDTPKNTIEVFNGATMQPAGQWTLDRPGQIALAPDGALWIKQLGDAAHAPRIVHYSPSGAALPGVITFAPSMSPTGFCVDGQSRLFIGDTGVDSNIKIYNLAKLNGNPTRVAGTFGVRGGLFSGTPGQIATGKFYQPVAVGTDNAGNIYICSNTTVLGAGATIESFDLKTGKRNLEWPHPLYGLLWLDSCDADPASHTNIYSGDKQFAFDYSTHTPGAGWKFKAMTCNPIKYPEDARLPAHEGTTSASVFARRIHGHLLLYLTNQYSGNLRIYRFNSATDGDVAIPCGYIAKEHIKPSSGDPAWPPHQPEKGAWMWRDTNGNGAFDAGEYEAPADGADAGWDWGISVDSQGDIWSVRNNGAIHELPLKGLDAHGSPIYNYAAEQTFKAPDFVTELMRAEYIPATDTMVLSAYTREHPHTGGEWGILGAEIICIGDWSKGNRTPRWRAALPYNWAQTLFTKSMCVAGEYIFATEGRLHDIHIYSLASGEEVGVLKPGPEVGGRGGWVDMTYGIQAFKRANGEYVVIEEEDGFIKNLVYRWKP
jgi:hypothetical protein